MRTSTLILAATLAVIVTACGSVPDRNPVPAAFGPDAEIPGIPTARIWGDVRPPEEREWISMSDAEMREQFPALYAKQHHYLAISGGGAKGAFTAGLLNGWTEAGTRPEFSFVTGVSTGALIAPFAFVGSEYDPDLKDFYTSTTTEDIVTMRSLLRGLTSDAMADSAPLKGLLEQVVDEKLLERVAEAHRSGRRLLIGTTNLDAARPVIWNMGAIATSDAPHRLELFRSVMLASASIPGGLPPVFIPVEADGRMYDEMHGDGGACNQVFLLPVGVDWNAIEKKLRMKGRPRVYIIRNSRVVLEWKEMEPKFLTIVERTVSSLIRSQGIGDLYRIWIDARENGMDCNFAWIPENFDLKAEEMFDKKYMNALYDLGHRMAKDGYPWAKVPPGETGAKLAAPTPAAR